MLKWQVCTGLMRQWIHEKIKTLLKKRYLKKERTLNGMGTSFTEGKNHCKTVKKINKNNLNH